MVRRGVVAVVRRGECVVGGDVRRSEPCYQRFSLLEEGLLRTGEVAWRAEPEGKESVKS